ncbi:hypothetical protein A0J61_11857, partial [Choanephora cucurbitarum]
MTVYSGKEVLHTYIKNTKTPAFSSFVNKYEEQIVEWSLNLQASNSRELHLIWVSRFNDSVRELRADVSLKKVKFLASKWDKFYEELLELRDMKQRSRIEGQKLVNKSLTNASLRSLRLLESNDAEGSSRSVVDEESIRMNEAEKGVLEDEDDLNEDDLNEDDLNEEVMPVADQLHMLYLKKFQKES